MRGPSLFIVMLTLTQGVGQGQENDPSPRQVLTKMFLDRDRLVAGDVRIRGVEGRVTFRQGANRTNERKIDERIRFDFRRGSVWHEMENSKLAAQPTENPTHRVTVLTPDVGYNKSVEASQITIATPSPPGNFWDVRAFGIATAVDLLDFTRLSVHKEAFTHYLDLAGDHVSLEGPDPRGMVVATIEHGSDPNNRQKIDGRSRFWIDTSRGHVPVRMESQQLDVQASAPGRRAWKRPNHWSRTSWELIDGIWVPTSFTVKHVVGIPDVDTLTISFDFVMEWLSVNPKFSEDEFSLEKLDEPKGSHMIVDARTDPPVIIQHPTIRDAAALEPKVKSNTSGDGNSDGEK